MPKEPQGQRPGDLLACAVQLLGSPPTRSRKPTKRRADWIAAT